MNAFVCVCVCVCVCPTVVLQMNLATESYCLPTNLTQQSTDGQFSLVVNNGFLLNINAYDNSEGGSEVALLYSVIGGMAAPTGLRNSCIRQNRMVEIHTEDVDFSALVDMSLTIEVGGMAFVFKYCKYLSP